MKKELHLLSRGWGRKITELRIPQLCSLRQTLALWDIEQRAKQWQNSWQDSKGPETEMNQ